MTQKMWAVRVVMFEPEDDREKDEAIAYRSELMDNLLSLLADAESITNHDTLHGLNRCFDIEFPTERATQYDSWEKVCQASQTWANQTVNNFRDSFNLNVAAAPSTRYGFDLRCQCGGSKYRTIRNDKAVLVCRRCREVSEDK